MIITRAPYRVSFFGGGSDLPSFYRTHGGAVLSSSINKYMYISSHSFFDPGKFQLKYSETECVSDIADIKHRIFKEVLNTFQEPGGLEISSNGDVPAGTGLGSSSAFTAALLLNLYTRQGKKVTKDQLAQEACFVEIDQLQEPIGKQDQYASVFGGINIIEFKPDDSVVVSPLQISPETYQLFQNNLFMFYTGNQRQAGAYLQQLKKDFDENKKVDVQQAMLKKVWTAKTALETGDLRSFATQLDENWHLKKQLQKTISNPLIDEMYEKAKDNGALGGKLLGAGGDGFMLFYCEKENHKALRKAMADFQELPMAFDQEGVKNIFIGDEGE